MIEIPKTLVNTGFSFLTVSYFAKHKLPPENFEDYGQFLESLRKFLEKENATEKFLLALDFIEMNPDLPLKDFFTLTYPFTNQELRNMAKSMRTYLYPFTDSSAPEILKQINLV